MDQAIFQFASGLVFKSAVLDAVLKFLAVYLIYAVPVFLIIYWFLGSKKTAILATFAGVYTWLIASNLIGILYFRPRPFTFLSSKELVFHHPTYSFPSDHAAFLFALAFSFYLAGEKKVSYLVFGFSIIISVTRVIVGLHWITDVLAGWALGLIAAWLFWLIKDPLDKWVIEPIIWAAKKVKLA